MKKTFLLTLIAIFSIAKINAQTKISLSPANVINISAKGNAGMLLDEQALAGDPKNNTGGQPSTYFFSGYQNATLYYPLKAVIDLGVNHTISDIYLFDLNNSDSVYIKYGNPSNYTPLIGYDLAGYNMWKAYNNVNITTRYLEVTLNSTNSIMPEIVLYGTAQGTIPSPPAITPHPYPLFDEFMGVNGFIDDTISRFKAVGHLREYHMWLWNDGDLNTSYPGFPNNQYTFNPAVSNNWNFDAYYTNVKNAGIKAFPAINLTAGYLVGYSFNRTDEKPVAANENAEMPASYTEHADYMFQYAARYGKTNVATNLLKLNPNNQSLSGLGLLDYMENWNEPDKFWLTRKEYFSPTEYAAMSSADCDGHMGALGSTYGMKAADPTMKFASSGITTLNLDWIKSIKYWCDVNRGGNFMFDAINFHHYSNDVGGQSAASPTTGVSPESDSLDIKLKKIVDYRNQYLPGKEVWLTEFGYDTNPISPQRAPAIGPNDAFEVQGQWIVRSFLLASASGIERATAFMIRDVNSNAGWIFASSGLCGEVASGEVPKKSWYYTYTLKNTLKGHRFESKINSGNQNVYVYKYRKPSTVADTVVYAVWCPTSNNTTVNNFTLNLGSSAASANQILLTNNSITGTINNLTLSGTNVTINVDERPQFIKVIESIATGIAETKTELTNVIIYPNPANNNIFIRVNSTGAVVATVEIINMLGQVQVKKNQLIFTNSEAMIDISALSDGAYFVRTTYNNTVYVNKFVK